jgi:hypothetical protein
LDFIAIGSLRVDPFLSTGTLLRTIDTIVVFGATTGFAHLVVLATSNFAVAAAAAIAVVLSPLFPLTFETPRAAGVFGACAAIALAAATRRAPGSSGWLRPTLQTIGVILVVALIAPPWCTVPVPDFSIARIAAVVRAVGWAVGPLMVGLAVLGAYTQSRAWNGRDAWRIAGVGSLLAALTTVGSSSAPIASVPVALVIWWFAAIGLNETIAAMGRSSAARVGGVILLVLVPTLQSARRNAEERDDRVPLNGHEQLTLQRMRALLNVIDVSASIAQEDASVNLVLRAAAMIGRPSAKRFVVVSPDADAVTRALASGPAYAFPRGQADLGLRGFLLRPTASIGRQRDRTPEEIAGLAAIVGRRPCYAMRKEWVDVGDAAAGGKIAVAAWSEQSVGPVTLILGGAMWPVLVTNTWTTRMIRGFHFSVYDRRNPAEADALLAGARTLGVPLDHPALAMPVVLRLSVHRIPRGPLALPVILGGAFPAGIARLDSTDVSQQLSVCDASAARVTPLEFRAMTR